jgi:hypothetical protein
MNEITASVFFCCQHISLWLHLYPFRDPLIPFGAHHPPLLSALPSPYSSSTGLHPSPAWPAKIPSPPWPPGRPGSPSTPPRSLEQAFSVSGLQSAAHLGGTSRTCSWRRSERGPHAPPVFNPPLSPVGRVGGGASGGCASISGQRSTCSWRRESPRLDLSSWPRSGARVPLDFACSYNLHSPI